MVVGNQWFPSDIVFSGPYLIKSELAYYVIIKNNANYLTQNIILKLK